MTKFNNIYDAILEEYEDAELALMVTQIYTINLTTKIKKKHLIVSGSFTEKVKKKAIKLLWEYDQDKVTLAIGLWDCIYDWELKQSLGGLGGCVKRSFKEIHKINNPTS